MTVSRPRPVFRPMLADAGPARAPELRWRARVAARAEAGRLAGAGHSGRQAHYAHPQRPGRHECRARADRVLDGEFAVPELTGCSTAN